MKESLESITKAIDWYAKTKNPTPVLLLEALRQITGNLYLLEQERSDARKKYEAIIFDEVNNGSSVARAENMAEVKIPELYMLRRIMDGAYRVSDAIRTTLSFMKHEQSHLNAPQ